MMKVVKLDGRHNLYRKGYTHAFRFNNWNDNARAVENALRNKVYKNDSWRSSNWDTFWGKANRDGYDRTRPYWIGVRNEAVVTQILLSL
jgi:hypothetical protein